MTWSEAKQPPAEPLVVRMGRVRIKGQGTFPSWAWRAKSLVLTNEALVIPGNKIPLDHITKVERVDLKPYCLLVQVKKRTYHLSFANDEELYDWQDDVYSRCPLIGVGSPEGFTHNVHVGFDQISSTLPSQWNALIDPSLALSRHHHPDPVSPTTEDKVDIEDKPGSPTTATANPLPLPSLAYTSADQTAAAAVQRGAARPRSAILDGQMSIKTDGFFTGWRWLARWIVLRNKTLTIYRFQGAPGGLVLNLSDITKVELIKARRLRIHTKSGKRYSLSFRVADEAYAWRDALSPRITVVVPPSINVHAHGENGSGSGGGGEISHPWGFVHRQHVGFDPRTGEFTGLPESWKHLVQHPSGTFVQPQERQEQPEEREQPGVAQPVS